MDGVIEKQLQAKRLLKENRSYLTHQQMKTLNGLIKSGNVEGAMNGLHTIMARMTAKMRK